MRRYIIRAGMALCALGIAGSAGAVDWSVNARLTVVEVTYVPNQVNFQIDQAAGACPAGAWIFWYPAAGVTSEEKAASASAILATLLAAQETGKQVTLIGVNAGCQVQYIYKI